MLDPDLLRDNYHWVAAQLERKKFVLDIDKLRQQESLRKILQKKTETLQSVRKTQSKHIGIVKNKGENIEFLIKNASLLDKELTLIKSKNKILQKEIKEYQLSIPNVPDSEIPDGYTDQDNVEVMRWGVPCKYNFPLRDHITLGKLIGGLDFLNAAKLTGSRFVVMKGKIATLHRALSQFMMDLHVKTHGYEEYYLPYLVNKTSLYGSGQLPKFYADLFHTKSICSKVDTYTLIPTAEVPLVNLLREVIVNEKELPIKMVAHTPCFRSEAGTYGQRGKGLIRMHQFDKVEIVQIVHPDYSMQTLEEMTGHAEKVLQLLKLPYRKMLLCAGNISFTACKTYDLEAWFPTSNTYCEVSSCSNVGDFQSRRIYARYREQINKKLKFLHILNASGIAIGRTLAAVLENYQLQDGSIKVPSVLSPYMHGLKYVD